jgi:hypothetical protein
MYLVSHNGHLGADLLELLLGVLGLFLAHALLDLLGEALNEVLGLLEREAGERAHHLDGCDTRAARYLVDDDVELRLLGGCLLLRAGASAAHAWRRDHGSGGEGGRGDAEALLQVVDEAAGLLERQPSDGVPELHDLGGLGGGGRDGDGAPAAAERHGDGGPRKRGGGGGGRASEEGEGGGEGGGGHCDFLGTSFASGLGSERASAAERGREVSDAVRGIGR